MNHGIPASDVFFRIVDVLRELGDVLGYNVQVTQKAGTVVEMPVLDEEEQEIVRDQQRKDLAWFEALLTREPTRFERLRGYYVAVYREEVVSVGPNEKLVREGAADVLGIAPRWVLVLPVAVAQSEEYWENLRAELGIG